ncbi:YfaS [Elusimicrobium simillimum]|uniref:alpha-2-macroglobulin family protein n=1 Tax=Elusimicrobium simillimum TaxID=3143438 RepID=UPI003C6EAA42
MQGKAYLIKAGKNLGKTTEVEELARELMNTAKVAPTTMHFELDNKMPWIHASNLTTTAVVLDAMLQAKGGFTGDEKAVRWLLNQATQEGHWATTANNSAVFRALNSYYTVKENVTPDFKAELKVNSAAAWTGVFKGREMKAELAVVPFSNLFNKKGESDILITKKGDGRLYYTMRQIYAPLKLDKPVNAGFAIERKVTPVSGEGTAFKAGQKAEVTLTVTTNQDRQFVVVEDFLPAGFEIVDSTLATESQFANNDEGEYDDYDSYYSKWGTFERNEKYDDRIAVFADYLTKGKHTYKYVVQATLPGTYSAPAAWASQMYEPENFGHNTTGKLTVE